MLVSTVRYRTVYHSPYYHVQVREVLEEIVGWGIILFLRSAVHETVYKSGVCRRERPSSYLIPYRFQLRVNQCSAVLIELFANKKHTLLAGDIHVGQHKVVVETIHPLEFENRSYYKRAQL